MGNTPRNYGYVSVTINRLFRQGLETITCTPIVHVILREEKDQLLKEKDELQMKLMAFQEVLEDLKQ